MAGTQERHLQLNNMEDKLYRELNCVPSVYDNMMFEKLGIRLLKVENRGQVDDI